MTSGRAVRACAECGGAGWVAPPAMPVETNTTAELVRNFVRAIERALFEGE